MAKTLEQKATAAQAKAEANPTKANVVAATKLQAQAALLETKPDATKKELATAAKQGANAVNTALTTLQSSQRIEIDALKDAGQKDTAKKEAVTNKSEVAQVLADMAAGKAPSITTTKAYTYNGEGSAAQQRIADAVALQDKYNLTPAVKDTARTDVGISLAAIDKQLQLNADTGKYGPGSLGQLLGKQDQWQTFANADGMLALTEEQVGGKLKEVKGQPGVYQMKINASHGDITNTATQFFVKNKDNTYTPLSADMYINDVDSKPGSVLPTVLSIAAAISGNPWLMGANAVYQASEGNWLQAALSAYGAGTGVDSAVMADAAQLSGQGLSQSQIMSTLQQTYGLNAFDTFIAATGGAGSSMASSIWNNVTLPQWSSVADWTSSASFDTGLFSGLGDTSADIYAQQLVNAGMSVNDAITMATQLTNAGMNLADFNAFAQSVADNLGTTNYAPLTDATTFPVTDNGTGIDVTDLSNGGGTQIDLPPLDQVTIPNNNTIPTIDVTADKWTQFMNALSNGDYNTAISLLGAASAVGAGGGTLVDTLTSLITGGGGGSGGGSGISWTDIFNGGGGGGSGSGLDWATILGGVLGGLGTDVEDPVNKKTPWTPAIPYLKSIMSRADALSAQGSPYTTPESMVAALTPEQLAAQTEAMSVAGKQVANAEQVVAGLMPWATGQRLDIANDEIAQNAIAAAINPLQQQYLETIMPSIRRQSSATGGLGGSRQGVAEALAAERYAKSVGDLTSTMTQNLYNRNLQQQISAGQLIPQYAPMQMASATTGQAVGKQNQDYQQQLKDALGKIFQQKVNTQSTLGGLVSGIGGQGATNTQQNPDANIWSSILGGAIQGSQIGKALNI